MIESNVLYKKIDTLNLTYYRKEYLKLKNEMQKACKERHVNNFTKKLRRLDCIKAILFAKGVEEFEFDKGQLKEKKTGIKFSQIDGVIEPTIEEINAFNLERTHPQSTFGFGKYKGKKIVDIAMIDADYICWCIINLTSFYVSDVFVGRNVLLEDGATGEWDTSPENGVNIMESLRGSTLFYQAEEINIIKHALVSKWNCESELVEAIYKAPENEENTESPWDDYNERDMIDDAFENDTSSLWNVD